MDELYILYFVPHGDEHLTGILGQDVRDANWLRTVAEKHANE